MSGLKRAQVVNIARLSGSKNFSDEKKKFIFNTFINLKPVEILRMGVI